MNPDKKDPHRYDDIIHLPHYVSTIHPRMSDMNRAAQFAPFAALTGYEDAISETGRLTDRKVELDENSREILDEKVQMIMEQTDTKPEVKITYFVPDDKKAGGTYVTVTGIVKKIDLYTHSLILIDGTIIQLDEIVNIEL